MAIKINKIIYIDFDDTICPNGWEDTPPQPECIQKINEWFNDGHLIFIYSCRSNPSVSNIPNGEERMVSYLEKHGIKYHAIAPDKPYFNVIIDDRCANIPKIGKSVDWTRITI